MSHRDMLRLQEEWVVQAQDTLTVGQARIAEEDTRGWIEFDEMMCSVWHLFELSIEWDNGELNEFLG